MKTLITLTPDKINRAGLSEKAIQEYLKTDICKKMIVDGDIYEPLDVYPIKDGKYTLADGIHRFCVILFLKIPQFLAEIR